MVHVLIVNYNHDQWLLACVSSVLKSKVPLSVTVISNSTLDADTLTELKGLEKVEVKQNRDNLGFALANNLGIQASKAEFVLVLNPDTLVTENFLAELIKPMQEDPSIGAVCGKLLRFREEAEGSATIDSSGLIIQKNRRAFDRGQGEVDKGQYERPEYIFGCSGAAVLYRRKMLEDICLQGEYFDGSFFAYKEDVDLAWRAQLKGWKAFYKPQAIAYHRRGWKESARKSIPKFVQIHSYKNRYLTILKNDTRTNILKAAPYIISFELLSLIYIFVRAPYLLKAWKDIYHLWDNTMFKRKMIQKNKKVSDHQINQWFK